MLADSKRTVGPEILCRDFYGKEMPFVMSLSPHRYYKLISSLHVQYNQFS